MLKRLRQIAGNRPPARLAEDEDGAVTIASLLWILFFLMITFSSIEMGVYIIKQTLLDRSVSVTSRILQLGLSTMPKEDVLRRAICKNTAFISDCMDNLTVETYAVNQSNWTADINANLRCDSNVDSPAPTLQGGQDNTLILMRVCLKQKPMMAQTGFAQALMHAWGYSDKYGLAVTTAFVNEPRAITAGGS